MNYRLALLCESLGDMEGAEEAINAAFKHAYFNEILLTKHRVEAELKAAVGADSRPLLASGHVTTKPTYWDSTKEQVLAGPEPCLSAMPHPTRAGSCGCVCRPPAVEHPSGRQRKIPLERWSTLGWPCV